MMKHTKGQWTARINPDKDDLYHHSHWVDGPDGKPIAEIRAYPKGESAANARLIKEAPALVEALEGLFEHCAMIHSRWGDGDNTKEADAAISTARALLSRIAEADEKEDDQ